MLVGEWLGDDVKENKKKSKQKGEKVLTKEVSSYKTRFSSSSVAQSVERVAVNH